MKQLSRPRKSDGVIFFRKFLQCGPFAKKKSWNFELCGTLFYSSVTNFRKNSLRNGGSAFIDFLELLHRFQREKKIKKRGTKRAHASLRDEDDAIK